MKIRTLAVACVAAGVVAVACSSKKSSGGGALTGDLSGAVAIALRPASSPALQSFAFASPTPPGGCVGDSELVKVDSAGNAMPVLNESFQAGYVTTTSSNVLVSGIGYVTQSNGGAGLWCCLLAIPRASGSVRCLSSHGIGGTATFGGASLYVPGIATRGDEVFWAQDNADSDKAELVRWDGSSDQRELLAQLSRGSFIDAFAKAGAPNVCAVGGTHGICGNPDTAVYQPAPVDGVPLQVGSQSFVAVMSSVHAISLTDLSTVPIYAQAFPSNDSPLIPTPDGGAIYIGSPSSLLMKIPPSGDFVVLDNSQPWQFLIGTQNYAFVYANSDLRRVDLGTAVVGTSNYLSTVNLLEVTAMWLSAPDVIRLDGTGANGLATSVFIDAITGDITTAADDGSRFSTIVPIQ